MDEKSILTKPKSIIQLFVSYFYIFIKNYKLVVPFFIISLIVFYFVSNVIETGISNDINTFQIILYNSLFYTLLLLIPVTFISTLYLTILRNKKPQLSNIIDTFLDDYWKIISANFVLCFTLNCINGISIFLMKEYQLFSGIQSIFFNLILTIFKFLIVLIIYSINPYRINFKNIRFKIIIKYLLAYCFLIILLSKINETSYYFIFYMMQFLQEIIGDLKIEYIISYWTIFIHFVDLLLIATIPIYIYYNFAAETRNTFVLEEINQIKLGEYDEENEL